MRHSRLLGIASLLTMLAILAPVVAHARATTAFIDMNDNGLFDAGDLLITDAMVATGSVTTTGSIVVPPGARLTASPGVGLDLAAGRNVTIQGNVAVPRGALSVSADSGQVTVGAGTRIMAGAVHLAGGLGVSFGTSAMVDAQGDVLVEALAGAISGDRVRLSSREYVEIIAWDGEVSLSSASLQGGRGTLSVHTAAASSITGGRLTAAVVAIEGVDQLDLRDNVVRAAPDGGVFVDVEGTGSRLDVSGTRFLVPPASLLLNADTVIQ